MKLVGRGYGGAYRNPRFSGGISGSWRRRVLLHGRAPRGIMARLVGAIIIHGAGLHAGKHNRRRGGVQIWDFARMKGPLQ